MITRRGEVNTNNGVKLRFIVSKIVEQINYYSFIDTYGTSVGLLITADGKEMNSTRLHYSDSTLFRHCKSIVNIIAILLHLNKCLFCHNSCIGYRCELQPNTTLY